MKIIRVKGQDKKTGKLVEKDHVIEELLDCVCETYEEYITSLLYEAIGVAKENGWLFIGFEIIAD